MPAPDNDNFAARYNELTATGTGYAQSTVDGTVETREPGGLTATAWWGYYGLDDPMPAAVDFVLSGWTTEHTINVYTGADLASLVLVATGTTVGGAVTVTLDSPAAFGDYKVQIGTAGTTGSGTFAVQPVVAPEPDPDVVEDAVWQDIEDGTDVPPDTVVPADLTGIGVLRRISETYPTPTLDPDTGRPVTWTPTSTVDEEWGTVGIAIDGVDVTKVRGVKSVLADLMLQEPFGEGPATLLVPGASRWDEGTVGYEWLAVEKDVDISHFDPAGAWVKNLWSGVVLTVRHTGDAWELGLMGAFAGPAGLLPHRPKLIEEERDWGKTMTYAIRRAGRGASRRKTITAVDFGILTRDRGARSETLLEYVSRGLGMSQTADGEQWTLARVLDGSGKPIRRKYGWQLKDRTTQHLTLYAGARGVSDDLTRDLSDVVRQVFGEGVNREGGRWRGTVLPNIGKETVPTYPGTPLDIGSDNDSVKVWQIEALSDGHKTGTPEALTGAAFSETDAEAAREIQEEAGLPVTGIVDSATWDATWSNGDPDLNLGGARFDPIAADTRVRPFLYSSNGSVLAVNPAWDRSLLPLGRFVSYGQNVEKRTARKSAKAELARVKDPVLYGTITIDGTDPVEMSRLDIREGMNVRYVGMYGDPLLHISGVRWARSGPSWAVTLTVDSQARDLLTLAQIQDRNRAARQDPVRQAISQLRKSAQTRDTPGVWDSEGGYGVLPERDATANQWNVYKVAAGQYGSLARVLIRTDPVTRFCVALFGAKPGAAWLDANVPNPLVDYGDGYLPWDEPSIQDELRDRLFIEAWGAFQQAAGYSPGYETNPSTGNATSHPITGKLDVFSSTDYALAEEPKMWVAFYPLDDTTVKGRVFLLANE